MDSKASDLRSPIPPIPHRRQLCIGYQQSYVLMLNKYSVSHKSVFTFFLSFSSVLEHHGSPMAITTFKLMQNAK